MSTTNDTHTHTHGNCGHDHKHDHDHSAQANHPSASAGLSGVKHVIAIASGKGGVGKSTVTSNLAVALRYAGSSVALMDADIYGPSQPGMLGAPDEVPNAIDQHLVPVERHGISFMSMGLLTAGQNAPLIWRAPMAMKVIQQFVQTVLWGKKDFLLMDLPPGTGDVQITLAQVTALSGAIIVTTPQDVALGIARKGLQMFQKVNVPILGIIENMSGFTCSHCNEVTEVFGSGGGKRLADEMGVPFLGSIPLDPQVMAGGEVGVPLVIRNPDHSSSKAFIEIALGLQQRLKKVTEGKVAEPKSMALNPQGWLEVSWPDETVGRFSPEHLRINCICAACVDENTGKKILDPNRVPADIQIRDYAPIGRYAIGIEFSDGHSTGIYSFERLKQMGNSPVSPVTVTPTAEAKQEPGSPGFSADFSAEVSAEEISKRVSALLESTINPQVASHGGKIELVEVKESAVYLKMTGGCQGCGAAKMTLKQGVEKQILQHVPGVTQVIDVTDHATGANPFYK